MDRNEERLRVMLDEGEKDNGPDSKEPDHVVQPVNPQ